MKDILTARQKAGLKKYGAALVKKNTPWPLPPELARKYHLYHVVYREAPGRNRKTSKGTIHRFGPMAGETMVAIRLKNGPLKLMLDLVRDMSDFKKRRLICGVVWDPVKKLPFIF